MVKKGQTAVPTILLVALALFIWFLLWIQPQQRYELLYGEEEDENGGIVTIPENIFFQEESIGIVGRGTGELLDEQSLPGMSIDYPSTRNSIVNYGSQILNANLLINEYKNVDLRLASPDSQSYSVEVITTNIRGSPDLRVTLNNTLLHKTSLIPNSRVFINISRENYETLGYNLRIECDFGGYVFWETQKCGFEKISVYEYVYSPIKERTMQNFYLSGEEVNAGVIGLTTNVIESSGGEFNILFNNKTAWTGSLEQGTGSSLSFNALDYSLSEENTVSFKANPGASYTFGNINMSFYSSTTGPAEKYVVFDLSEKILRRSDRLTLEFELTEIFEPGDLKFTIIPTSVTYTKPSNELYTGNITMSLSTNDLKTTGNNIKIHSDDGRFKINELIIKED